MVTRPGVPGAKAESLQIVNTVFIHMRSKGAAAHILGWSVTSK